MDIKNVTNLIVRGREFKIIYNNKYGKFLAIEDKYLDENGCLTKTLNGLQMHASETVEDCVKSVRMEVEAEYLVKEKGYDMLAAMEIIGFRCANGLGIHG